MPKRIQQSRRRGWRLPENAKIVTRGTRWGNPYRNTTNTEEGQWAAVTLYRHWLMGNNIVMDRTPPSIEEIQRELRGKDLACWCKPGEPCHADVLLEIANNPTP